MKSLVFSGENKGRRSNWQMVCGGQATKKLPKEVRSDHYQGPVNWKCLLSLTYERMLQKVCL